VLLRHGKWIFGGVKFRWAVGKIIAIANFWNVGQGRGEVVVNEILSSVMLQKKHQKKPQNSSGENDQFIKRK